MADKKDNTQSDDPIGQALSVLGKKGKIKRTSNYDRIRPIIEDFVYDVTAREPGITWDGIAKVLAHLGYTDRELSGAAIRNAFMSAIVWRETGRETLLRSEEVKQAGLTTRGKRPTPKEEAKKISDQLAAERQKRREDSGALTEIWEHTYEEKTKAALEEQPRKPSPSADDEPEQASDDAEAADDVDEDDDGEEILVQGEEALQRDQSKARESFRGLMD